MHRRALLAALAVPALPTALAACREPARARREQALFDHQALTLALTAVAERARPGDLGVAVQDLTTAQRAAVAGDHLFPLAGVWTAPLASAVLAEVDAKALSLTDTIEVEDVDLSPPPGGVADAWPGRRRWTVEELLKRAVAGGDNTAADVLMKRIGGPGAVTAWLDLKKVENLRVDRYARQLLPEQTGTASFRAEWRGQAWRKAVLATPEATRRAAQRRYLADPRDSTTPLAALRFLEALNQGELTGQDDRRRLLRIMEAAAGDRLRPALPAGARLAAVISATPWDLGLTAADNTLAMIRLKDGRRFAVAIFLKASPLEEADRDALMLDVMRTVMQAAEQAGR
ncbi:serine hydrolase [Caulobacter endophyticus]|uniref:serine hydrolase n=1 Tax=Caulobacter endophyticus TaxID=2172652 RepID=UPI00240F53B4|nr:serine hydrolase [Caulobacter endophyticus]MDG2530745.1 serine hydrolase [Caulobacter endophyticus]